MNHSSASRNFRCTACQKQPHPTALLVSDESLPAGSRLTVTRLVTVSRLLFTILHGFVATLSSHVHSSGEKHNSGIVDFPASHRLEAARPPINLRTGPAARPQRASPCAPPARPLLAEDYLSHACRCSNCGVADCSEEYKQGCGGKKGTSLGIHQSCPY